MAITTFATLKTAIENWLQRTDQTSRTPEFVALAEDRIQQDLRVRAMETTVPIRFSAGVSITAANVAGTANAITLTTGESRTSNTLGDRLTFTAEANNTAATTVAVDSVAAASIKKKEFGASQALESGDIRNGVEYYINFDGTDFLLVPPGGIPLPSRYLEMRRLYLAGYSRRLDYFESSVFWTRKAVTESGNPRIYTIEGDFLVVAPVPDSALTLYMNYWRGFAALSADADVNWIISNARGLLLYGSLLEAMIYLEDGEGTIKYGTLYQDLLDRVNDADKKGRFPRGGNSTRSEVGIV